MVNPFPPSATAAGTLNFQKTTMKKEQKQMKIFSVIVRRFEYGYPVEPFEDPYKLFSDVMRARKYAQELLEEEKKRYCTAPDFPPASVETYGRERLSVSVAADYGQDQNDQRGDYTEISIYEENIDDPSAEKIQL